MEVGRSLQEGCWGKSYQAGYLTKLSHSLTIELANTANDRYVLLLEQSYGQFWKDKIYVWDKCVCSVMAKMTLFDYNVLSWCHYSYTELCGWQSTENPLLGYLTCECEWWHCGRDRKYDWIRHWIKKNPICSSPSKSVFIKVAWEEHLIHSDSIVTREREWKRQQVLQRS